MTKEVEIILAEVDKLLEINESVRKYAAGEHKLYSDAFKSGVGLVKKFIVENFS